MHILGSREELAWEPDETSLAFLVNEFYEVMGVELRMEEATRIVPLANAVPLLERGDDTVPDRRFTQTTKRYKVSDHVWKTIRGSLKCVPTQPGKRSATPCSLLSSDQQRDVSNLVTRVVARKIEDGAVTAKRLLPTGSAQDLIVTLRGDPTASRVTQTLLHAVRPQNIFGDVSVTPSWCNTSEIDTEIDTEAVTDVSGCMLGCNNTQIRTRTSLASVLFGMLVAYVLLLPPSYADPPATHHTIVELKVTDSLADETTDGDDVTDATDERHPPVAQQEDDSQRDPRHLLPPL